jgi:hypothetical protein
MKQIIESFLETIRLKKKRLPSPKVENKISPTEFSEWRIRTIKKMTEIKNAEFDYIKLMNYKNHPDTFSSYWGDHISEHEYAKLADFLRDCLLEGTRYAIKKQGGYAYLADNPAYWSFFITLGIRAKIGGIQRLVEYILEINETMGVSTEAILYKREMYDSETSETSGPYFLNFSNGVGSIITNEKEYLEMEHDWTPCQRWEELPRNDMLAVRAFGRQQECLGAQAVYQFINGWML